MDDAVVVNSENPVAPVNQAVDHEPQQQAQEPIVEAKAEDRQERNWREVRRQKAELEKRLELQEELIKRLMANPQVQATPEVDELEQIPDNEFIPKGQVKQLVARQAAQIAEKIAREESQKLAQQHAQSQFMSRLKTQYPDFDQVVTADTLAQLEETEPELAQTIADLKDPYKIGMQSYKYIKAFKLGEASPKQRHAKEVEKKIEQGQNTVQSPQAYDKRPMAQAFKMTDAQMKELYKEMTGYAAQAGFGY